MKLTDEALTPLYQQIINDIVTKIETGVYAAGDRIPSELELSEAYGVSRITIRRAITDLCDDGLLSKMQGKGTFVNAPKLERKIKRHNEVMSFTETCKLEGKVAGAQLIDCKITSAKASVAKFLGLGENDKVIEVRRVRTVDGLPLMIENNCFSAKGFEFLLKENLTDVSLFDLMCKKGHRCVGECVEATVEITRASKDEADLLSVSVGEPLFCEKVKFSDSNGKPFIVGKQLIVGKLYMFNI